MSVNSSPLLASSEVEPPRSIFYVDDENATTTTVVDVDKATKLMSGSKFGSSQYSDASSNKSASLLLAASAAQSRPTNTKMDNSTSSPSGSQLQHLVLLPDAAAADSHHHRSSIPHHSHDAFVPVPNDEANASLDAPPRHHKGEDAELSNQHPVACCAGGGCGNVQIEVQSSPSAAYKNVGIAIFVALLGLPEGYFFAHCGLYAPASFILQMRLESFLLLKVFVSGVGASMLAQALMAAFHVKQFEKSRSYRQDNNGWLQVVGGCGLLGIGMAVSGSGPTMLPTQLGAGIETAGMVLVGCLVGGALYAIFERFFSFRIDVSRHISDKVVVEDLVHIIISAERIESIQQACTRLHLYQVLAVPMGLMMIGAAFLADYLSPHSADAKMLGLAPYSLTNSNSDISSSSRTAQLVFFHPIAAGIVLGVNQVPLRFIQDDGQGGSTAIMNMVSYFSSGKLSSRHNIKSWKQGTQIIYVYVGTLIGAILGFMEIGITTNTPPSMLRIAALGDSHWTPWRAFLGGLMMVFGARVAGGCTCGHGISGVSELSLQSFAGAAAIFGGGIAITFAIGL